MAALGLAGRAGALHGVRDRAPRRPRRDGVRGPDRVISDRHFPVQLNRFIPGSLSYSVPVFLAAARRCARSFTLSEGLCPYLNGELCEGLYEGLCNKVLSSPAMPWCLVEGAEWYGR
jgi:hypothetical protein